MGRVCGSILVAALPEASHAVHRGKGIEEAAVALVHGGRGGEFVTITREGKPVAVLVSVDAVEVVERPSSGRGFEALSHDRCSSVIGIVSCTSGPTPVRRKGDITGLFPFARIKILSFLTEGCQEGRLPRDWNGSLAIGKGDFSNRFLRRLLISINA